MDILVKFKNILFETLKDNKKLIIGLYILFIICFIASWILSASRIEFIASNFPVVNNTVSTNMGDGADVFHILFNNVWGGIVTYILSIFFAIPAFVLLIYNGVNLGVIGQLFSQVIPNGGLRYIVYIIPHGIFEITATVLQSVAGVLLFLFIWRLIKAWRSSQTQGISDAFDKTKQLLIQSIVLMIFSTILLIIAAPIEIYFSVPFSQFILGV